METGKEPVGLPVVSEIAPAGVTEFAAAVPEQPEAVPVAATEPAQAAAELAVRATAAAQPDTAAAAAGAVWSERQCALADRLAGDRKVLNIAVTLASRYPTGAAEDLMQETIMRIARNADKINLDSSGLYGLVRRTMEWVCVDASRRISDTVPIPGGDRKKHRQRRFVSVDPDEMAMKAGPATTEDAYEERARISDVAEAVGQLSESHRAVVYFAYYRGLNTKQISEKLDIAEGTVKSRLFYAMRKLRELLGQEYQPTGLR